MGGYGSGEWTRPKPGKPLIEREWAWIDVGKLVKRGVIEPGASTRHTLSWQRGPERSRSLLTLDIEAQSDEDGRGLLVLGFVHEGRVRRQWRVRLQADRPHFGGLRWFFACPECSRLCKRLYLRNSEFWCRRCHGLDYASNRQPRVRGLGKRLLARLMELDRGMKQGAANGPPPDEAVAIAQRVLDYYRARGPT